MSIPEAQQVFFKYKIHYNQEVALEETDWLKKSKSVGLDENFLKAMMKFKSIISKPLACIFRKSEDTELQYPQSGRYFSN